MTACWALSLTVYEHERQREFIRDPPGKKESHCRIPRCAMEILRRGIACNTLGSGEVSFAVFASKTPPGNHHGRMGQRFDVPFPLDHFFFCFFAPVLAGAILTVLRVEMGRFGGDDRRGRSRKKVRSPVCCVPEHRRAKRIWPWHGHTPGVKP